MTSPKPPIPSLAATLRYWENAWIQLAEAAAGKIDGIGPEVGELNDDGLEILIAATAALNAECSLEQARRKKASGDQT